MQQGSFRRSHACHHSRWSSHGVGSAHRAIRLCLHYVLVGRYFSSVSVRATTTTPGPRHCITLRWTGLPRQLGKLVDIGPYRAAKQSRADAKNQHGPNHIVTTAPTEIPDRERAGLAVISRPTAYPSEPPQRGLVATYSRDRFHGLPFPI